MKTLITVIISVIIAFNIGPVAKAAGASIDHAFSNNDAINIQKHINHAVECDDWVTVDSLVTIRDASK